MRTIATRALMILISAAALATTLGANLAQAEETYLLRPDYGRTPKLGIYTRFIPGRGMYVTGTAYGTEARRLGIEAGDTIVAIDGRRMNYAGAFRDAVRRAMQSGPVYYNGPSMRLQPTGPTNAWVTLTIRDWRTGRLATRTTNLGNWD